MLRMAALASRVVASTPMVLPFSNPRAAITRSTNPKTCSCVSTAISRRVREKGRLIGAALVESNAQKVADTERIGGPPGDAAFGIDAFEIADEEGAEGDGRGEAGPAHFPGVELLAGGIGELVELFGFEQFIEPGVEGVSGRGRPLLLGRSTMSPDRPSACVFPAPYPNLRGNIFGIK